MKTVVEYRWRIKWGGRWTTTNIYYTEEGIRKEHPEAQPIELYRRERELPDTVEELAFAEKERLRALGQPSGGAAPGSPADLKHRAERSWQCVVLRLRYCGQRLNIHAINVQPYVTGAVHHHQEAEYPAWTTRLYDAGDFRREMLPALGRSTLAKEGADFRLYQGLEWDPPFRTRYPQSWLCALTPDVAYGLVSRLPARP